LLLLVTSPLILGALLLLLLVIESIACIGKLGQSAAHTAPTWPASVPPRSRDGMHHGPA